MKLLRGIVLSLGLFLASCGGASESDVSVKEQLCSSPHPDFNGLWVTEIREDTGADYFLTTVITTPAFCDAGQITMTYPFGDGTHANGFIEYNPGLNPTLSDGQFSSIYGYYWLNIPGQPCTHPGGQAKQWTCRMKVVDSTGAFVYFATWIMFQ